MPATGRDIAEFFAPRAPLLPLDEFLAWGQGLEAALAAQRCDLPLPCGVEDLPPSTAAAHIGGSVRWPGSDASYMA